MNQIFKRIRIKISKCKRYDIFQMEIPIKKNIYTRIKVTGLIFRNSVGSKFQKRERFKFTDLVPDPIVHTILTIQYVQTD